MSNSSQSADAARAMVHCPSDNRLLAALPRDDFMRLAPHLELEFLVAAQVLCEPGDQMGYVYFPTTAVVSLMYMLENGASAEIAVVGNEGILGISIFMGGKTTPSRAVVQTAGSCYRIGSDYLLTEFNRAGPALRLLLRYTQALIAQMSQTAVCNRHHSIQQQLSRQLLVSLDLMGSNSLVTTQELIASRLGVRREAVTKAAGVLQRRKVIACTRGHIEVLDRHGLETTVCECYQVVRAEFTRLLSDIPKVAPPLVSGPPTTQG